MKQMTTHETEDAENRNIYSLIIRKKICTVTIEISVDDLQNVKNWST